MDWVRRDAPRPAKNSVLGGAPITICELAFGIAGASWGDDGTIVFATPRSGLFRVSADGGEPRQLTKPNDTGDAHLWPEMLPGSETVLFTIDRAGAGGFDVAVLSLETGEQSVLVRGGTSPRYLPTGHIMYVMNGTLMVAPFDRERSEITDNAVRVLSDPFTKASGAADFDVSDDGVLIYLPEGPDIADRSLVWVNRQGREEPLRVEPRPYVSVVRSPGGDRIASSVKEPTGSGDIWIHDVTRGSFTRLTFHTGLDRYPVWTPDGEHVVFQSFRDGVGLFWKAANGTGSAERLTRGLTMPFSVSPDGRTLAAMTSHTETAWDIAKVSLEGDRTTEPLVADPHNQWYPQISPSGKWLAYHSRKSGRPEIFVRPYPNVDDGQWQVSTGGGTYPMWSPNEDELFYRYEDEMMAVPVVTHDGFAYGAPAVLFKGSYWTGGERNYNIGADGQRFLMIKDEASKDESGRNDIHVVLNWFEELRAL